MQVILDSHGEVAARVCSILNAQGHLEADAIAETAMVPAKDTREVRSTTVGQFAWTCILLVQESHLVDVNILPFSKFIDSSPVVPCKLHYSLYLATKQTIQPGEYDLLVDSG